MVVAAMRPFGRAQDLELEFAGENRPALVTALLAHFSKADPEFWWDQMVGARVAALLRVLAATDGVHAELTVRLSCAKAHCAAPFEVSLPFDALLKLSNHDEGPSTVQALLPGGRTVALRRPTGRDLGAWHGAPYATRRGAVAAMLDALVIEGEVTPDDEAAIADAMATDDPLVAFSISCACPDCGAASDHPVDLEAVVLAQLGAQRRGLLREIHLLASSYGWTESEILAVSPARRAQYRALVEDSP